MQVFVAAQVGPESVEGCGLDESVSRLASVEVGRARLLSPCVAAGLCQ